MKSLFKHLHYLFLFFTITLPSIGQPAPKLTEMWVDSISSSQGTEAIGKNKLITQNGHSGTTITFTVSEIGYGNNPVAKLNNISLTNTQLTTIVDNGIVIGFRRTYRYNGTFVNGGQFTYFNQSTNSPWNPMEVSLQILPYYPPPVFTNNPRSFTSEYDQTNEPSLIQHQFTAVDSNNLSISYSIQRPTGGAIPSNISITPGGLFYWSGHISNIFTRSTSCPYPYVTQLYVVATNSSGSSSKYLITLNVFYGPMPFCQPPPSDPIP